MVIVVVGTEDIQSWDKKGEVSDRSTTKIMMTTMVKEEHTHPHLEATLTAIRTISLKSDICTWFPDIFLSTMSNKDVIVHIFSVP